MKSLITFSLSLVLVLSVCFYSVISCSSEDHASLENGSANTTQPAVSTTADIDIDTDTGKDTEGNHMQDAKTECENLMSVAVPFAEDMLIKHHEFYPFGYTMAQNGEIEQAGSWTGEEYPESTELIKLLVESFRGGAENGKYKATAIVYDFLTIPPGKEVKQDAIAVALDHFDNYSILVVFPYSFTSDGQLAIEAPFAVEGEKKIFGQ